MNIYLTQPIPELFMVWVTFAVFCYSWALSWTGCLQRVSLYTPYAQPAARGPHVALWRLHCSVALGTQQIGALVDCLLQHDVYSPTIHVTQSLTISFSKTSVFDSLLHHYI